MKLTRDELEKITGEDLQALLSLRSIRLSTSPFGADPRGVTVYIGKAVPWKKRGRVPKRLHRIRHS